MFSFFRRQKDEEPQTKRKIQRRRILKGTTRYPGKFDASKSVTLADAHGNFRAYSTEELMAKKLNRFKGWKCSAGRESLHVGQKGEVLLAACGIRGVQGSAYKGDFKLPEAWLDCDREACMCGGDMQLRKARTVDFVEEAQSPQLSKMKMTKEGLGPVEWVGPYHFPKFEEHFVTVSWDMGKRCNYACSYCPPEVSNKTDPLKTWEELKTTTDNVIAQFGEDQLIKWVVTGGEPTIIPDYMKWVEYVAEKGHVIHTTTNGSRGGKYLEQLIRHSCIGISVHLEFLDIDRLRDTCEKIVRKKLHDRVAANWWFGVRVMVPPGHVKQAEEVQKVISEIPFFPDMGHFFVSPIHHYEKDSDGRINFGELLNYAPDEMERLERLF